MRLSSQKKKQWENVKITTLLVAIRSLLNISRANQLRTKFIWVQLCILSAMCFSPEFGRTNDVIKDKSNLEIASTGALFNVKTRSAVRPITFEIGIP